MKHKNKIIDGIWWIDRNNEILVDPMGMIKIGRIYPIGPENDGSGNGKLICASQDLLECVKMLLENANKILPYAETAHFETAHELVTKCRDAFKNATGNEFSDK